jgi:UDP-glucose 4-epimerase
MARVLITGSAGYVGSHGAKALSTWRHESIVFDNFLFCRRKFGTMELSRRG